VAVKKSKKTTKKESEEINFSKARSEELFPFSDEEDYNDSEEVVRFLNVSGQYSFLSIIIFIFCNRRSKNSKKYKNPKRKQRVMKTNHLT